jgi:hypothetical protein
MRPWHFVLHQEALEEIDKLRPAERRVIRAAPADLRTRREWDPLRNDPRFQKILDGPELKTIRK